MKKVALVGLGKWGKNILRELINLKCNVVLLLNSHNKEREDWLKSTYPNVSFTYDIEEIKKDEVIEDIFIATPISTHFDVCMQFAESNKKIYVEKPITLNADNAENLLKTMNDHKVKFMVGHIFLYNPCFFKMKEILEKEKIERINFTKTLRNGNDPHSSWEIFLDTFIHEMSVFLNLYGEPDKILYKKENMSLSLKFKDVDAEVKVKIPERDEKIRIFEFITKENKYIWNNDEIFDKSGLIYTPEKSALFFELDIFLNKYNDMQKYIASNNRIGVRCVDLLEKVYSAR